MSEIDCPIHGPSERAFVCQHIAKGLFERARVGFFWTNSDPDALHPDAWCAGCEDRRLQHGGEWRGEAEKQIQAKVLCADCYVVARTFHMGGEPWS